MDEQKRRELEIRRNLLRGTARDPNGLGAVGRDLHRRGIDFDQLDPEIWTPPYLAISSSQIDWSRSPLPAEEIFCDDLRERVASVRSLLERQAHPNDRIQLYSELDRTAIGLRNVDAQNSLDVLLDRDQDVWLTGRPKSWLIHIEATGLVRLALPPVLSSTEAAAVAQRQRAYIGLMVSELRKDRVSVSVFSRDDPSGPTMPRCAFVRGLADKRRRIGLPIPRFDYSALSDLLFKEIDRISPNMEDIAYDLALDDSPIVVAPGAKLLATPKFLMAPIDNDSIDRPADFAVSEFRIYPIGAASVLRVFVDGPRIKIEELSEKD